MDMQKKKEEFTERYRDSSHEFKGNNLRCHHCGFPITEMSTGDRKCYKRPDNSNVEKYFPFIEQLLAEKNREFVRNLANKQEAIFVEADRIMKESNGHYYVHMLKTRCQFCNKSEKDKRRCSNWLQTLLKRVEEVYLNSDSYPEIFKMETKKTQRGFSITGFIDRYGNQCSLQKSSIATEDCIWLGANKIGLQIFIPNGNPSWRRVSDEKIKELFGATEVQANTRMHLTQEMVKDLLPYLQKFAETGEIY